MEISEDKVRFISAALTQIADDAESDAMSASGNGAYAEEIRLRGTARRIKEALLAVPKV